MQSNPSHSVSHKTNLFSNFVFQTKNHRYKRDFRSESFVDSSGDTKKSPTRNTFTQTNLRSKTNISLNDQIQSRKVEIFRENSTQTSKTAVATVQTELDMRLSPDSLSPKQDCKNTIAKEDVIHMMESVLTVKERGKLPYNRKNTVVQYLEACEEFQKRKLLSGNSLTKAFLARVQNRSNSSKSQVYKPHSLALEKATIPVRSSPILKSRSYVEHPLSEDSPLLTKEAKPKQSRFTVKNVMENISTEDKTKPVKFYCQSKISNSISTIARTGRSTSFMSPTISSEQKDQSKEMRHIEKLISPTRRGRSLSPKKSVANPDKNEISHKVPYIDRSITEINKKDPNVYNSIKPPKDKYPGEKGIEDLHLNLSLSFDNMTNTTVSIASSTSTECVLFQAITRLKDSNWNVALRGLAEVVEICRVLDTDVIFPHMTTINQRIIELIRSSRSHVSRTACQAMGHLFEYVKDTRRPEFDEIVNALLHKTADSNRFIRHDANLALDCMVTHVGTFHAIRAICSKGPDHKNPLVRTATARLMVCAIVIAGPENILHPHNNEYTRKRIILNMVKFMDDKCHDTRKFGLRLYKLLYKDRIFEIYLKRYLEKDIIQKVKKCLRTPR